MTAFKDPLLPGALYHIFNRAVGREQLFVQPGNYDFFFSKLQHHIVPCAQILAYSFLPNHFHLMVRLNIEPELLLQLQQHKRTLSTADLPTWLLQQWSNCFNAYTKAFNKQQQRSGKLFEEPFRRRQITQPDYYTRLVAYIHCNAIKHRLAETIDGWPHSSFHQYLRPEVWLGRNEVANWFGSLEHFYRFHLQLGQHYTAQQATAKPRRSYRPPRFGHPQ